MDNRAHRGTWSRAHQNSPVTADRELQTFCGLSYSSKPPKNYYHTGVWLRVGVTTNSSRAGGCFGKVLIETSDNLREPAAEVLVQGVDHVGNFLPLTDSSSV